MGLTIELHMIASVLLFVGHIICALSYLGIAFVLQLFITTVNGTAKIVAHMLRLFSYFILACGIQHLLAALLFIYPLWTAYIIALWATGLLAFFTLIFIWQVHPRPERKDSIVVVPR